MRHAGRAGHPLLGWQTMMLAAALALGPRPAGEALSTLDAVLADHSYPGGLMLRGLLLAMLDRIEEAWAVALPADERLRELGYATGGEWLGEIAFVTGDYEAAAEYLRDACGALEAIGNLGELSTYAPMLGGVLCRLGDYDEAELLAQRGRELGDPEDVMTQRLWRQTQAREANTPMRSASHAKRWRGQAGATRRSAKGRPSTTSPRCWRQPAAAMKRSLPGRRRSTATSASRSSRSHAACASNSRRSKRRPSSSANAQGTSPNTRPCERSWPSQPRRGRFQSSAWYGSASSNSVSAEDLIEREVD